MAASFEASLENVSKEELERKLLQCCHGGQDDEVAFLLSQGVRVDVKDKEGRSGLMISSMRGYKNIVGLFLDHGANLSDRDGLTALKWACRNGHVNVVELLVERGVDVNVCGDSWRTLLMWACDKGRYAVVTFLIDGGVDVNAIDRRGETALMKACRRGHDKVVQFLIEHGADMNVDTSWGSVFTLACQSGNTKLVELLIEHNTDLDARDKHGTTGLMKACWFGHLEIVEILIHNGVSVNVSNGFIPLSWACRRGHYNVVKLLLESCAYAKFHYDNLLDTASKYGHYKVVELLLKSGAGVRYFSALMEASHFGHHKIIKLLLETGADVDLGFGEKENILLNACEHGHHKVVKLLLASGVDVNYVTCKGITGLMEASKFGHYKAVRLLLESGASVNVNDGYGTSILMHACKCKRANKKVVALLLEHGAIIDSTDINNDTAFMLTCESGNTNILKLLMKYGSDVNKTVGCTGETALMRASRFGQNSIIELLVQEGVRVNAGDEDGETALIKACKNGHYKTVELLIGLSADINIGDKARRNPLMMACVKGHDKIVELLIRNGANENVNARDADGFTALMWMCWSEIVRTRSDWNARQVNMIELLLQHGADIDVQHNSEGWSAAMLSVMANNVECLQKLLSACPNLDLAMVDAKGQTAFSYAMGRSNGDCMRVLMEDGRMMTNGKLKPEFTSLCGIEVPSKTRGWRSRIANLLRSWRPVQKKANNLSISLNPLLVTIEFGVFEWEWCPLENFKPVSLSALQSGYCPGKINYDSKQCLSPLVVSLLTNDMDLTETFLKYHYYFPEDYRTISTDKDIRKRIENQDVLDKITLHPLSLQTWSILHISKCLSLTGPPGLRWQRVNCLPIPDRFKRRLNFKLE